MTDPHLPPTKLSAGDRVGLFTVLHRTRTAILFGIVCGALLGGAMYLVLK